MTRGYDVVIVGGGHNGLTAAAYLGKAGKRVLVLEKLDAVGGAAVSAPSFEGVDAQLSRYSYLVSLLPRRIISDLGLNIRLKRRRYSSYTPRPGTDDGLLIDAGTRPRPRWRSVATPSSGLRSMTEPRASREHCSRPSPSRY